MYVYPRISRDDPGTSVVSRESWDTQTHGIGGITIHVCVPISRDDPGTSVVSWESWDTQTHGIGDLATCIRPDMYIYPRTVSQDDPGTSVVYR